MNISLWDMLFIVLLGIGAIAILDLWAAFLKTINVPSLKLSLIGRWVAHMFRGQWFHGNIATAAAVSNETLLGWVIHCAIGVGFALALVLICGTEWLHEPSFMPAILIGLATASAPLLIMQPALGAGIFSSKTPRPVFNSLKSIANHLVFGCGLYLAGSVLTHFY